MPLVCKSDKGLFCCVILVMKTIPINEDYFCVCSDKEPSEKLLERMLMVAESSTEDLIGFDYYKKNGANKKVVHQFINKYSVLERQLLGPYLMVRKSYFCQSATHLHTVACAALAKGATIRLIHNPYGIVLEEEPYGDFPYDVLHFAERCHGHKYWLKYVNRLQNRMKLKALEEYRQKVLVIVLSSNNELLYNCLHKFFKNTLHYDVDIHIGWYHQKGTKESSIQAAQAARLFQAKLHWFDGNESFNYSAINNHIFEEAENKYNYVLLLNDDVTILDKYFLPSMIEVAENEQAKVVGAELYYPFEEGESPLYQHGGIKLGNDFTHFEHVYRAKPVSKYYLPTREVSAVTFAAALIDYQHYADLKLDDMYYGDCNDVDFCLRTREAGESVWYCNMAKAIHAESVTRKNDPSMQNDKNSPKFYRRNLRRLKREFRFI